MNRSLRTGKKKKKSQREYTKGVITLIRLKFEKKKKYNEIVRISLTNVEIQTEEIKCIKAVLKIQRRHPVVLSNISPPSTHRSTCRSWNFPDAHFRYTYNKSSTYQVRSVEFVSRSVDVWILGTRKSLDPWRPLDSRPFSNLLEAQLAESIFHRWPE